jgi:putative transposase
VLQKLESAEKLPKTVKRSKLSQKSYVHPIRARRYRIHPTPEQRKGLDKWFGAVRFCYNLLVAKFRTVGQFIENDLATFRKVIKDAQETYVWLNDIPGEVKDVAVTDFQKARIAHFAKLKLRRTKDPNAKMDATFKFRSKRDKQQSFSVRARDMVQVRKHGAFFFIRLASLRFAKSEIKPMELDESVRFVRDRLNKYYLVVSKQVPPHAKREAEEPMKESFVALDPGVRTFQTTYDLNGQITEWGKGDMKQLFRQCLHVDKIQATWQKKKGAKKRSTKRAMLRATDRIRNRVKEVHRKMAKWLCESYEAILIPPFETKQMANRTKRKINSKTARQMLTWSHYTFKEMLKAKAEMYTGVRVIECNEAYTSKTCGQCGRIHTKLGGSKTYKCKGCGYEADRDMNAARNIMLRYLCSD